MADGAGAGAVVVPIAGRCSNVRLDMKDLDEQASDCDTELAGSSLLVEVQLAGYLILRGTGTNSLM